MHAELLVAATITKWWWIGGTPCTLQKQSITELLSRKFRAVHCPWKHGEPLASLLTSEDGPMITAGTKLRGEQGHCRFTLGLVVAEFELCFDLSNDRLVRC
jgi:hypothetical protein